MPFKHEGKDQDDASGTQAKEDQRLPANQPEARVERHGTDSSSQLSEGTNPPDSLLLDF